MERLIFGVLLAVLTVCCTNVESDICRNKAMSLRQILILNEGILCFCLNESNEEYNSLLLFDYEGSMIDEIINLRSEPIPVFEVNKGSIKMIYDYPVSRDSLGIEREKRYHASETYKAGTLKIEPYLLRNWKGAQIISSIVMDSISLNRRNNSICLFQRTDSIKVSLENIRFKRDKTYIESFDQGIYKYSEIVSTNGKNVKDILIQKIFE